MTNDTGNQRDPLWQFHFLEHPPFMLVAWIRCFNRETSCIHPKDQVDNVLQWEVIVMGTVVAAPADMQADVVPWDPPQGVVESIHPHRGVFAVFRQGNAG